MKSLEQNEIFWQKGGLGLMLQVKKKNPDFRKSTIKISVYPFIKVFTLKSAKS